MKVLAKYILKICLIILVDQLFNCFAMTDGAYEKVELLYVKRSVISSELL